jgi:hypothetical protein
MSLKLLSLLQHGSLEHVPFDETVDGSPLVVEAERFAAVVHAELEELEEAEMRMVLCDYESALEVELADSLKANVQGFYERLGSSRRVWDGLLRFRVQRMNHRCMERLLRLSCRYGELEHVRQRGFDAAAFVAGVKERVEQEDDPAYERVQRALARLTDDYGAFRAAVCACACGSACGSACGIACGSACGMRCDATHAQFESIFDDLLERTRRMPAAPGQRAADTVPIDDVRVALLRWCPTPAMVALVFAPELNSVRASKLMYPKGVDYMFHPSLHRSDMTTFEPSNMWVLVRDMEAHKDGRNIFPKTDRWMWHPSRRDMARVAVLSFFGLHEA